MKTLRAWIQRVAGLFGHDRRDRELAAEMDSHLQLHIDDNLRAGMTPGEARRAALLKLGGLDPTLEACRERTSVPVIEHLLRDVRFAARQLRKNAGFTSTAIVVLALGICASVAIFAFVDAALIQPLPYPNPGRLVGVYEQHPPQFKYSNLSYQDYLDWKKLNNVFTSLEAYNNTGYIVTTAGGAEPSHAAHVSAGFFRTLGIAAAIGRDFHEGEDRPGAPHTVILSNGVWRSRYGSRADVVGQTVLLDSEPYVVIGVLPRSFQFAPVGAAEYWTPIAASSECSLRRSCHNLFGVARLKDGVSMEAALADLRVIARQLEAQYPGSNRGQGANTQSLTEAIVGDIRPILMVLLGGAGLLLLIACINVASLLLVRSESRRREMAVRSALGASRARLICQFVTEGMVLVAAGTALGLGMAVWTMRLLSRLIQADMLARLPFLEGLGLNARGCGFALAVALGATALFAVTPALRLQFGRMQEGLAEGSRGSAGTTWRRLGSRLVVLELATAVVLLVGAGLLGQSLYRLLHVYLGLEPVGLVSLDIAAPDNSYGKDPAAVALEDRIMERVMALPGIQSAGMTSLLPVTYNGNTDWIRFVGKPYNGEHNEINERDVSGDYLKTIGAKLVRGRYFGDDEDYTKPRVAVINQALAKKYYPGEDPIGKVFGDDGLTPKSLRTIVGIVEDVREGPLDGDIWPAEYLPMNQNPNTYYSLVVRTAQGAAVLPALAATIRRIDPGIVTLDGTGMPERIENSSSAYLHRSAAWLVSGFAGLALLLGVVGLYGVVAYSVSQRTREIGVRIALGAQRGMVYRMILREAGWLTAVGIGAGIAAALAATSLMRKLLFGVESWDVPTMIGVAVVLACAALAASYWPARRAASVNPVEALRAE